MQKQRYVYRHASRKVTVFVLAVAIMLTTVLSAGILSFGAAAVWDGSTASGFASGNGTSGSPYLISTPAEWAYFAEQVTAGTDYSGKFIKLTADLTFNEGNASAWKTAAPAKAVPTVGADGKPFKGTFDGQGHTLSGVYINGGKNDGTALFGEANGATIQNLVIGNSAVIAEDWCGILIGEVSGGINVKNVVLSSDTYLIVTRGSGGSASAGGFVGGCYGSTYSSPVTIGDSVFCGTVELTGNADKGYIGGFVGNGNTADGKVHDIVLTNCLMAGKILSSKSFSSGFVGGNGDTKGKFSDTAVTMTGCVYLAGEAGHNAADGNSYPFFNTVKNGSSVSGCYSNMSGNQYKTKEAGSKEGVDNTFSVKDFWGNDASVTVTGWTKRAGDVAVPDGVASFAPASGLPDPYSPPEWLTDYETTTSFYIENAQMWNELCKFVAGEYSVSGNFAGKNVVLAADIEFNTGDASGWGSKAPQNKVPSLGSDGKPFCGTFDGQSDDGKTNYVLSGVYMNSTADGTALFGEIGEGAVIRNVTLKNSYIKCKQWSAALVGEVSGGATVKNCYVASDVTVDASKGNVGGIVGGCYGKWTDGKTLSVNNCVFAGALKAGDDYAGGILGNSNYQSKNYANLHTAVIENCLNTGRITGKNYVAGIAVGSHLMTVSGCVNTGIVRSSETGSSAIYADIWTGNCNKETEDRTVTVTGCRYVGTVGAYNYAGTLNEGFVDSGNVAVSLSDLVGTSAAAAPAGWKKTKGELVYPAGVAKNKARLSSDRLFTVGLETGASVRLDTPTGLRFTAVLSKTYLASLGEVKEYGIVIAPTAYVSQAGGYTMEKLDALTVEGVKYLKIPAEKLAVDNEDYAVYTGVIVNILENNYSLSFSAIAYVEKTDGTVIYSAYDPLLHARSVSHVARMAHEDVTETSSEEYATAVAVSGSSHGLYSPYTAEHRSILEGFYRGEAEVRVLQQNLHRDEATEEECAARFLAEVKKYDPDVILLQEVDKEGKWYSGALKYLTDTYTLVGVDADTFKYRSIFDDYPNAPGTYITAILYRTERFDATESGTFWLTNTPAKEGTETFDITVGDKTAKYEQNAKRPCNYVNLTDKNNGNAAFTCASVHLSTNNVEWKSGAELERSDAGSAVRAAEAQIIMNYLASKAGDNAILFGGDINDSSSSLALKAFRDGGYADTYSASPVNVGGIRSTKTQDSGHIDWCLVSADGYYTVSYRALNEAYLGTSGTETGEVSDHLGVISDVLMIG